MLRDVELLEAVRAHRQRQRLECIAASAGGWAPTMPLKTDRGVALVESDLVFTTTGGRPLAGSYIDEGLFGQVCRKAGISYSTREQKGLRFHDLRHSAATVLLAAGVPERVVVAPDTSTVRGLEPARISWATVPPWPEVIAVEARRCPHVRRRRCRPSTTAPRTGGSRSPHTCAR